MNGREDGKDGEGEVGQSGPSHSEWMDKEGERKSSVGIDGAHV